jgi:hypothetical protein
LQCQIEDWSKNALLAYLVLDEELDTLDGGSGSLGDGGGNTTHYDILVSIRESSKHFIQLADIDGNQPNWKKLLVLIRLTQEVDNESLLIDRLVTR